MNVLLRRILYAALAIALLFICLATYVAFRVGPELQTARAILRSPREASLDDLDRAKAGIERANSVLNGVPARILRLLPVSRQNIDAVRAITNSAGPVLESAAALRRATEALARQDLVSDGTVDIAAVQALNEPLADSIDALGRLEDNLKRHRTGWLLPPVWTNVDDLLERTIELRATAGRAEPVVSHLSELLGEDERRDYLVLLMNNAELRGAGGIASGIGIVSADRGRLRLGPFSYYQDVDPLDTPRTVKAPPAYERRFARVGANTTLWLNVTYSPDVTDVALVAERLYKLSTGRTVDGAIIADARGFSALLPPDAQIEVPALDRAMSAAEIPRYAYVDQYRVFEGPDPSRREGLVDIGREAFGELVTGGSLSREVLQRAGGAIRGGHIRFLSFDPQEADALVDAGVAGDLSPTPSDSLLVAVQNLGGDKLDYWIDRKVDHLCDIRHRPARCVTQVTLTNKAPSDLPEYVAPRPAARTKEYLEIYVPDDAEISHVEVDGAPAPHFDEEMSGLLSVGLDVGIDRGDSVTATVGYYLPFDGNEYSLVATPQPLARDAEVTLTVQAPEGWVVRGPNGEAEGSLTHRGTFDRSLELHARPLERPSGLAGLWSN